ncbi:hypothetical protein GO013_06905 [Pseudodesulfovibrio sp. JC047]|uniref:hypothetical protein n=1 Tax=Pseudodesulfovibrio sp. JC047 TaxID=2683199 RepID=UPI0013D5D1E2|nr:hypothetical protein [Pseudodesulfovibrio sp. JC047]NDV19146.1 hypothetical protein [Pseudodesulfovibrio sp. JC047]
MRSYLIEDLSDAACQAVMTAFDELGFKGALDGIYYLPLPVELLQKEQQAHQTECGPYFMALECLEKEDENSLKLELLVRGRKKMRCSCIAYATPEQRAHMIDYLDQFLDELEVAV